MNILSGKYDSEVAILQPVTRTGASGSQIVTYNSVITLPCYINDRMNNEQFLSDKKNDIKRITLDVRFEDCPEGINTHWQLNHNSLNYAVIEAVEAPEFGRRNVMRLRGELKA